MKRKLLPFAICVVMIASLTVGCGKNEAVVEVSEQKTESRADDKQKQKVEQQEEIPTDEKESDSDKAGTETNTEETVVETNVDLRGTKKAVSAIVTDKSGKDYEVSVEYNNDGTYLYRIKDSMWDNVYYFAANGLMIYTERYSFDAQHPDGNLFDAKYGIFGLTDIQSLPNWKTGGYTYLPTEIYSDVIYDENGTPSGMSDLPPELAADVGDFQIEKDSNGRITRTSCTHEYFQGNPGEDYTEYQYPDENTVIFMSYKYLPDGYDAETRTQGIHEFQRGYKIINDSYGLPVLGIRLDKDGNEQEETYVIEYNEYGYIKSYNGSTFAYTYDDGSSDVANADSGASAQQVQYDVTPDQGDSYP